MSVYQNNGWSVVRLSSGFFFYYKVLFPKGSEKFPTSPLAYIHSSLAASFFDVFLAKSNRHKYINAVGKCLLIMERDCRFTGTQIQKLYVPQTN